MRINALTRSYEQEFTKYGISYKVFGGFKFFERKEIKDILAYLRVVSNPFDEEAIQRIINVPRRGIGDKTISSLLEYAEANDLSLYEALTDCDGAKITSSAKAKLNEFGRYIKSLVYRSQETEVNTLVKEILDTSGSYAQYQGDSDEMVTKRANLDEFQNSVDEFVRMNSGATLSDYLQQITLYSDTDDMDDGDYVTIATVHAVKGLEFRCVFFCGLEENIMPTSRAVNDPDALEEERRLMYVAITRARERLWLTRSLSRYLYGKREPTVRSRFVEELRSELGITNTVTKRYSGDFYGGGYGGYGGRSYGGYQNGVPVRTGSYSASRNEDGAYRTFGSDKKPASSAPVRFGNVGVKQNTGDKNDVGKFAVGVKVRHARFGEGEVVALRGSGRNLIITVAFREAGNKDLAAALAPLEII